jgi:holin-like protein
MMATVTKVVSIAKQLSIVTLVSLAGDTLVAYSHLPVPGSVAGMVILFSLLSTGILKPSQIREVSEFLLKHMSFFFIPVAVGLMNYGDLFYTDGLVLFGLMAVSLLIAFAGFCLTGFAQERRE